MTSIDKFEDHCWKDVIPEADIKLYAGWRRETFVGPRPALLAIDLYDLVYRGGPHSPYELNERYPNTCGIFAHRAIEPTKRLFAAARARRHSGLLLHPGHAPQQPAAGRGLDPAPAADARPTAHAIYHEFTAAAEGHRHLPSSAPALSRARRCSRICRCSASRA